MTERPHSSGIELVDELTSLALVASTEILRIREGTLNARHKPDATPVTDADHAAEEIVLEGLSRILPGLPVVSEEDHAANGAEAPGSSFALVDPLDGTREFIAGRDEFTVNIAIIEAGIPIIGIVAAPARHTLWRGMIGQGAQKLRYADDGIFETASIEVRKLVSPRIAAFSRSHADPQSEAFAARWPDVTQVTAGSSLKFALVAEGQADIYPRLSPTCEWDIAAGHALVASAGGLVVTPEGEPLRYGQADRKFIVPGFVAWANPDLA